jgi:formylglycine-generating enzyme required for sulfatase activity
MKRLLHLLSVLLVAAILPACSKKPVDVTGQIFVVTKGRENIKMGGLEVRLIPDGEFLNMAKATVPWMQEEVRKEAQFKADADFMTAFIKELLAMEEAAPNPIPELQGIRKAIVKESGVSKNLFESASSGQILQRGMGRLISSATSTLSVTTDADGRFTVPITGKTWFLAVGQREVGEDMEEYLWVKGFEPQGDATSATLAISNEADIDSEDGLYSLLSGVIGSSGDLDEFRKVEVSEQMKSLVARHREAANAAKTEAEHAAAEAKAKAERLAAEAKTKAEREAAEAKAKLPVEIGAGRVGATLGVPLAGKAVMPFAFCPVGAFTMGSPASEDEHGSDENQVRVTLSKSFWLAKTEVTQSQWQAVMGDNPSNFKGHDLPVENVSWNDAQTFIKKVNGSGVMPAGWEMALPTEAQWEYACRAGETGAYSGGTIDQVAWYSGNSESKTHDVGTKKANAWGLHDMHGNVWEWCADWYDDTLPGGTDPSGPSSGVDRVYRGGSWSHRAARCRAAFRDWNYPGLRGDYLGFRPAIVPSK